MKKTAFILLSCAALLLSGCATGHHHVVTWDYKVIETTPRSLEKELGQLSADGWAVVSSSATIEPPNPPRVLVILKRPKK